MLSRRGFVAALGAMATPVPGWADVGQPVALSCARGPDGGFVLVGLSGDGQLTFQVSLPSRGHAGAAHPERAEAVVMARRPGTFALVMDCESGEVRHRLTAPDGRHFYGHAAYSADGNLLFTTENDFATGEGRIGIWDRRLGYARIDEFASGGIGPHEIIRLPDGNLAVANGGIRTHPDRGREKLNLETMEPNLTVLRPSGSVIDVAPANAPQNSLRHIAADAEGRIVVGYQWQGDPFAAPSLVGVYEAGTLKDLDTDDATSRGLQAYVGSVAASPMGAVVSSPRGGVVHVYGEGGLTLAAPASDICGLCSANGTTLATAGQGRVYRLGANGLSTIARHDLAFDNHMVAL